MSVACESGSYSLLGLDCTLALGDMYFRLPKMCFQRCPIHCGILPPLTWTIQAGTLLKAAVGLTLAQAGPQVSGIRPWTLATQHTELWKIPRVS